MLTGYLLLLVSTIAFGSLGIFHKVADHPQCRPKMTALLLYFWGSILMTLYTLAVDPKGLQIPSRVVLIGAGTGLIASLTLFTFQTALRYGKISTSWLIINLTTSVPVLISIFLFGEKLNAGKSAGILLVFAAIVMLWWDKKIDLKKAEQLNPGPLIKSKWLPLMMLTFVGQGLASTGSKVLVEAGVGDFVSQFLIVLYGSGTIVLLLLSVFREQWPNKREISTALVMAICSVVGNGALTSALKTVKGSIAYPVNNGSLLIVVLGGVLFFRERIHPIGVIGIACGVCAVLILI